MKTVLQSFRTGRTSVVDAPAPACAPGQLLIRTSRSLVSAGTERMLVDFGKAGWIGKARAQPDRVRQVIGKARTDGILPTLDAVRAKLDQPIALGYCNVGTVVEAGAAASGFKTGDRVASNSKHAEIVAAPVNLCARVPDGVSDEEAAFTVLGAIALQGIRLVAPSLGEAVVVTGLGLVGLLTVQLLRAHGCRVLGLDFDAGRLELARSFGAETVDLAAGADPMAAAALFSRGRGVDAVIVAAATDSSEPMRQAAEMCRKRGRIVLVGVAGLELSRADFFAKELTFQVSCSYGPGRYDPAYEEDGQDYPVGFVRWTEQRNFEAVLDMMAEGRIDVTPLVSHRFPIADAEQAYALVGGGEPSLGILLTYDSGSEPEPDSLRRRVAHGRPTEPSRRPAVGFIGSGSYATTVLIPAFQAAGADFATVASKGGVSGVHAATKFGFRANTTDTESVLADPAIDAVAITTRHSSHARLAAASLRAGKHVFIEKPLAITLAELTDIEAAWSETRDGPKPPLLTVGFNRRFAPHVVAVKKLLSAKSEPKAFIMTVNAGAVPPEHWTQAPGEGGRIIGEACHFIDLVRHLAGAPVISFSAIGMAGRQGDSATIHLAFENGSIGTIHYLANGSKSFPKERLEIFSGGSILAIDNFRRIDSYSWPGAKAMRLMRQDKGQRACAAAFLQAIENGGEPPIAFAELIEVAELTIAIADELKG